ncbi:transposase, partial [bacterium]|nr:transposase [bacterium]MBU1025062.1 transposase [bacterium]
MPRPPRIIIPNIPYQVTQRGNHGRDVFYHPDDRNCYLEKLALYSVKYRFEIQAYCLMTNHIHLIGIPRNENSIAKIMQVVQSNHTQAVNRSHGWTGNLWQQRYFASALSKSHMWNALRYVEQNPVRAGIVAKCEDYLWSSAAYHCGFRDDNVIIPNSRYSDMYDNWHDLVNQS